MAGRGSSTRLLALTALLAGQAWSLRTYSKDNTSRSLLEGPWKPWELMQRIVGEKSMADGPRGRSLVAFIEGHPSYTGLALQGTVQVRNHNDGIAIQGVVTGLSKWTRGTLYIYEGFSCQDHQNPMTGLNDTWSADGNGLASIFQKLPGWSLWGTQSVVGRALVLHDEQGVKIGCGMLEMTLGQVSHISQFPGVIGYEALQGTLVTQETSDGILLTGTLGGLPPLTSAGIRIHSGYSCSAGPAVGAHYTEGVPRDSWSTSVYTSDAQGNAQVSLLVGGFSLYYDSPVMGRVIVVNGKAPKIGCGVIGNATTLVASFGAFPGYEGKPPSGTVAVTASKHGVQLEGVLTGLPPSIQTVATLHSGFDCTYAMTTGEAYQKKRSSNLGTASFKSDDNGVGSINKKWQGFSISDMFPLAGRVLVISDSEGLNMGCATMKVTNGQVTQLGKHPGYTGTSQVKGTVITTELRSGIKVQGTVANLPLSSEGSYQIHEGFSCEGAEGVGAPYVGGSASEPASTIALARMTTTYASDSSGSAQISEIVSGMSLYDKAPVMGRTIVFDQSEDHFACGLVGRAENLVASMGATPNSESPALSGTVHAVDVPGGIRIRAVLNGMNVYTSGSLRIHSGFSCSSPGTELAEAFADATVFKSDQHGSAAVDMNVHGFTLAGPQPVAGLAVVLNSLEGKPIGCGLLQVTPGHVTHIGAYPGSNRKASGVIVTEETETGITMHGTIAGLPPNTTAGVHFASGYSCMDEKAVGDKYYSGMVANWGDTKYVSDDKGAAQIFQSVKGLSLFSESSVLARAVVLEGPDGGLGCGPSAPAELQEEAVNKDKLASRRSQMAAAAAEKRAATQERRAVKAAQRKAAQQQEFPTGGGSEWFNRAAQQLQAAKATQQQKLATGGPSPWLSSLGIGVFVAAFTWSAFMSYISGSGKDTVLDPDAWVGVDSSRGHHRVHVETSSGFV